MIIGRKSHAIFDSMFGQIGRQYQEIGANRIEGGEAPVFGKTEAFEPMNDIGSKEKDLEKRNIGGPISGRDLGQGIIVGQFADLFFDIGPERVKEINPPSSRLEIGDKDMIGVSSVLEQSQLCGFGGIFRDGSAHHHKAVFVFPFFVGFDPEFRHLPAIFEWGELAGLSFVLNGMVSAFLDDNDITAVFSVDEFHRFLAEEAGVHTESDTSSRNRLGYLGQTNFEKGNDSSGRGRIARSHGTMPEFFEVGLETKQRMVGAPPMLFGIVTHPSTLVFAVDHQHRGIDIEDQTVAHLGKGKQISSQTVVKSDQLPDRLGCESFEKSPQTGLVRKTFESQHFQEGPVVLQNLGLVDTPQPHNDCEHQGQKQFGRMVFGTSLEPVNIPPNKMTKSDLVAKTLNHPHPAEEAEVSSIEGKLDFPGSFWHVSQNILLVWFVTHAFSVSYYTSSSSDFYISSGKLLTQFTLF